MMNLHPCAVKVENLKGRIYEPQIEDEDPFIEDILLFTATEAKKRLSRKGQVSIATINDHAIFRDDHSIRVGQRGKYLALKLGLNATLVEATGYMHDVGHPPGGHAIEEFLDEMAKKHSLKGFNHNTFGVFLLCALEKLNLNREVIDGMFKNTKSRLAYPQLFENKETGGLIYPNAEAQVDDYADSSLSYIPDDLIAVMKQSKKYPAFAHEELRQFDIFKTICKASSYKPGGDLRKLNRAFWRMNEENIFTESKTRIKKVGNLQEMYNQEILTIAHSGTYQEDLEALEGYLSNNYWKADIDKPRKEAMKETVKEVFDHLLKESDRKTDAIKKQLDHLVEENNPWLTILLKDEELPKNLDTKTWSVIIRIALCTDIYLLKLHEKLGYDPRLEPEY